MTDDIIERLRWGNLHHVATEYGLSPLLLEAADVIEERDAEIERLRAEIERLSRSHDTVDRPASFFSVRDGRLPND